MPYVTDTHSLVWHLTDDPKLSASARKVFKRADNSKDVIFIPCIVLFELIYLIEKKKINVPFDTFVRLISSSLNYKVEPICLPVIEKTRQISRKSVKDPWDRLIAATSMHLNLPLITHDRTLRGIGIKIVVS